MTAPAMMLNVVRCANRNFPTQVADAPRTTKTTENPTTKARELRSTRPMSWPLASLFSSSTEAPESMEIYPGTRGSTQGERKETSPATNAIGMLSP